MTREEEIQKASKIFHASSDEYTVYKKGFEEGAKWADEHPNKCLIDIDDAIRWLKDNANKFIYVSAHTNTASINEHLFAEEFAEAMSNNDVVDTCDTCKDNQYCSKSNYVKSHCYKR